MASSTPKYSEETVEVFRQMFHRKDKDETGTLNAKELKECLQLCGLSPTNDDITFLIRHFDKNGDGKLQIEELLANIEVLNEHSVNGEQLMAAFNTFDVNKDGFIRLAELVQILTFNDFMTQEAARHAISSLGAKYDADNDGRFNYIEFVNMFANEGVLSKRMAGK